MPSPIYPDAVPAPRHAILAFTLLLSLLAGPVMAVDTWSTNQPPEGVRVSDHMIAARAAISAKDWKKSIAELTVEVRKEPGNADAHNLLAYSYRKQATPDLPKAFEHYTTALKLDPKHRGAHEYIGEAYLMAKQPAKAEEHLVQLRQICGNTTCEEYADLAKAVAEYKAKNK